MAPPPHAPLLRSAAVSLAVAAAVFAWLHYTATPPELPVLGVLPEFSLVSNEGRPLSSRDLRGSVWVANFIFTTCPSVCPMLSARMAKLQRDLPRGLRPDELRLVSFTVDPATDTPTVLRAYAERFDADPERWWFLTGERAALYELIRDGFRLAVAEAPAGTPVEAGGLITHSERFVLVDSELRIRGYYSGSEPDGIDLLRRDAVALATRR